MRLAAGGFVSFLYVSAALAQPVTGDTCNKLAETIAAGYSTSFSDRSFEAAKYYANCEASQSASNAGLNIAYGAFSLGAKYDEAQRKAYCSKSFESYNIKSTEYNSVKIVFNQALATIDKCLDVASKGWAIRYERITADTVTLNISNGGNPGGRLLGIDIVPVGALNCSPALPTEQVLVTTTNPISTTCSRTPTTQMVEGMSVTSASEAVLNLRLGDGVFPIRLSGYSSSLLEGINKKIETARSELTEQVNKLRADLVKSNPENYREINSRDVKCGEGEYLVGFYFEDQPGLGHGALWGPRGRCRKLNLGAK